LHLRFDPVLAQLAAIALIEGGRDVRALRDCGIRAIQHESTLNARIDLRRDGEIGRLKIER
jgi:hypothetical protein